MSLFDLTTEEIVEAYKDKTAIDLRKDYEQEIELKLESLRIKIKKCDNLIKKYENKINIIDENIEELLEQEDDLIKSTPMPLRNSQNFLQSKLELNTKIKKWRSRLNKSIDKLSRYSNYKKKFNEKIIKREKKYKKLALAKFQIESPLLKGNADGK